jgi:peptidoglycan/LPS O-acetylase OafA/YrhL
MGVVTFSSNFVFWKSFGYFAAFAQYSPLLHTWSLAVEEQFYIVYPLILTWLQKIKRSHAIGILTILFLCSLIGCVCLTLFYSSAAFYLSPLRAWELIGGAIIAYEVFPVVRKRLVQEILSWTGLFLIIFSINRFNQFTLFPGLAAIVPCAGAGLIVYAHSTGETYISRALGSGPLVFIGLISYSLYLWHWPLLVFARIAFLHSMNGIDAVAIFCLSFAAATLSLSILGGKTVSRSARIAFSESAIRDSRRHLHSVRSILVSHLPVPRLASTVRSGRAKYRSLCGL